MIRAIRVTARFLCGRELHNFDACAVWVVSIQAVFAVAADFWAVECLQAVQTKLARGSVNVFHAQGEMVLHSELFVVGVCRNIEHVFDPVGAVGNLEFVPIGAVIFKSAVPVKAKPEEVNVKTILGAHVFDDETCMDQVRTDLRGRSRVSVFR